MILRNSKEFLQVCKMLMLAKQGNVMIAHQLREHRNIIIEIIFTNREYYKLLSFTERIPLNFSESFYTGLCSVRHSPSTIINSWYYEY